MATSVSEIKDYSYKRLFYPEKIAIIGVSTKGTGFGSHMCFSLRSIGYNGKIYLINPKGGSLNGEKVYKSVADIPEEFDLAIIAVSARYVPQVLEACRLKGAAAAEILSSGFKELGTEEGAALEEAVVREAGRGIRVIGPNCFGIYCPESGLTLMPGPDLSRTPGPVAFSSQSGGMAVDFANLGKSMGLTFSKIVSFGNGADLRETELLKYFAADPQTGVIALYIEGVRDGDDFFDTIREVGRIKPVVVMKGGLSEAGSRAVMGHTASMGGNRRIWQSVLSQANAVQVGDMNEMAQACLAFSYLPAGPFRKISVLGGGGALGVGAGDSAEAFGIKIPRFSEELAARIDAFLPKPGSSPYNPVDLADPWTSPQVLKELLTLAAEDERVELQVLITMLHHYKNNVPMKGGRVKDVVPCRELAEKVRQARDETGRPVIVILNNPKQGSENLDVVEMIEETRTELIERGIPAFDDLNQALRAIKHVNTFYGGKANG